LHLWVRKFACVAPSCQQRIFTERLPAVVPPYARRTARQADLLRAVAFALGGAPGSRLLDRVRMAASASTLIRLIRRTELPEPTAPRVLGVDEWARRKGRTYSTILVDLERRQVVDLLPEQSADAFADWLAAQRQVEIVSRDRAGAYAEGATRGAPQALQVADRWHILRNLAAALEHQLAQHSTAITQAFAPPPTPALADAAPLETGREPVAPPLTRAQLLSAQRRTARLERFETVRNLHAAGASLHAVARQTGVSRHTVQKYVRAPAFPEYQSRAPRPSRLDPYKPYLLERWNAGCHDGTQLWREIQAQGYRGGRSIALDFFAALRRQQGLTRWSRRRNGDTAPATEPQPRPPSRRQLVWQVMKRPETLTEAEQEVVTQVRQVHGDLDAAVQLTQEFAHLVRERHVTALEPWLWRVANSELSALRSFAAGIQRDKAAVVAALEWEWSQGQVEGSVNRLKLIKRGMYGRAKFDLLRKRVLYAA